MWRVLARFAVAALTGFRQGCSRQDPHCPTLYLPRRVIVHSQHVPEDHHGFRPNHERQSGTKLSVDDVVELIANGSKGSFNQVRAAIQTQRLCWNFACLCGLFK